MRRIIVCIIALLSSVALSAQDYCRTTWPYLYEDFTEGTIYLAGGTKLVRQVNVCVADNKLHFLDKEVVKEANMGDILVVEIGEDSYRLLSGMLLKIEAKSEAGVVASFIEADLAQLNETGGAYGSSGTSSATQRLSSVSFRQNVNMSHMQIMQEKDNGQKLSLKKTYYVVYDGQVHKAVRSTIERGLDKAQKDAFKSFLKTNKVKWMDSQSLLVLVDFFKQISEH